MEAVESLPRDGSSLFKNPITSSPIFSQRIGAPEGGGRVPIPMVRITTPSPTGPPAAASSSSIFSAFPASSVFPSSASNFPASSAPSGSVFPFSSFGVPSAAGSVFSPPASSSGESGGSVFASLAAAPRPSAPSVFMSPTPANTTDAPPPMSSAFPFGRPSQEASGSVFASITPIPASASSASSSSASLVPSLSTPSQPTELRIPQPGEWISLPATQRPDGTWRAPRRVRAGFDAEKNKALMLEAAAAGAQQGPRIEEVPDESSGEAAEAAEEEAEEEEQDGEEQMEETADMEGEEGGEEEGGDYQGEYATEASQQRPQQRLQRGRPTPPTGGRLRPNLNFLTRVLDSTETYNTKILPHLLEEQGLLPADEGGAGGPAAGKRKRPAKPTTEETQVQISTEPEENAEQETEEGDADSLGSTFSETAMSIIRAVDKMRRTEGERVLKLIAKRYGIRITILPSTNTNDGNSEQGEGDEAGGEEESVPDYAEMEQPRRAKNVRFSKKPRRGGRGGPPGRETREQKLSRIQKVSGSIGYRSAMSS